MKDKPLILAIIKDIERFADDWGMPDYGAKPPPKSKWVDYWLKRENPPPLQALPSDENGMESRGAWPLLEALDDSDRRVRHGAALALMHIHNRAWFLMPQESRRVRMFPHWNRFLKILMEALYEGEG
jgi:hypothetical protein